MCSDQSGPRSQQLEKCPRSNKEPVQPKIRTKLKDVVVVVQSLSPTLVTPWTVALQAPLSMGFPSQEDWSGLPFPSPGDIPDPEIEPTAPALAGRFFTAAPPGRP